MPFSLLEQVRRWRQLQRVFALCEACFRTIDVGGALELIFGRATQRGSSLRRVLIDDDTGGFAEATQDHVTLL